MTIHHPTIPDYCSVRLLFLLSGIVGFDRFLVVFHESLGIVDLAAAQPVGICVEIIVLIVPEPPHEQTAVLDMVVQQVDDGIQQRVGGENIVADVEMFVQMLSDENVALI